MKVLYSAYLQVLWKVASCYYCHYPDHVVCYGFPSYLNTLAGIKLCLGLQKPFRSQSVFK